MDSDSALEKWIQSANAWISDQGVEGDWSRRAVLDPVLDRIFSAVAGKSVLDLGCGEGRYSRKLSGMGAIVTGIDPVPQIIEHARALDSASRYVEGRAESLPFVGDSFEVVLSGDRLHTRRARWAGNRLPIAVSTSDPFAHWNQHNASPKKHSHSRV